MEVREFAEKVVARGCGHYASREDRNLLVLYSDGSEANAGRDLFGNPVSNGVLWMRLNWLRAALSLAGWLAALKALSLLG